MKNKSKFLNISIIFLLNIILIFAEYYLFDDFISMVCGEWYLCAFAYVLNALVINPIVSFLIDYYFIAIYI